MILLTGLTGKSGGWLARRLAAEIAAGHFTEPLRVVARPTSNTQGLADCALPCELLRGDLADADFVAAAMRGVHTVLHTSNICFSENIVRAALAAGVRRVILVHTTGIYSRYKTASAGYLAVEENIQNWVKDCRRNISLTILRPTMVYGSLHDGNVSVFIRMVERLRLFPVVNGGRYPLQPVHAKDLGNAYYQVLTHPEATLGKDYVLSGESPIFLIDLLKTLARLLGVKTRFVPVPYLLAYAGAAALYGLSLGKKDYRERVQRLVEPRAYPHDKATQDFGFAPMSFEEGAADEVAQYQATVP